MSNHPTHRVIPAQAGIQGQRPLVTVIGLLDSRLRGNDIFAIETVVQTAPEGE